jgi:hypothetical protein
MAINRFNTFSPTAAAVPDFFFDVVRGAYGSYYQTINISGMTQNLNSAGAEVFLNYGGSFEPYEPETWKTIKSSSTDDTLLGAGARKVFISGVTVEGNLLEQTVNLNGTSAVTFPTAYRYINNVLVTSAGNQQYNVGTLKIENAPGVADIDIGPKIGSSQMGGYFVPNGYRLVLMGVDVTFAHADANCDLIFTLRKIQNILGGLPFWQTQYRAITSLDHSDTIGTGAQIRFPILFNPGELVQFTAQTSAASGSWVSAQGYGVLIADS